MKEKQQRNIIQLTWNTYILLREFETLQNPIRILFLLYIIKNKYKK